LGGGFEVNSRQVFRIAGPAMIANVTTPLLGIVATAAIGRLGDAAILGGVGMASVVFDCLFWLFGFLRMGAIALTAQALGADDILEQRAVLARSLIVSVAIGASLIALQIPLAATIFPALGGSDAVRGAALTYFQIRLWSAPFALGNYVFVGWLVGLARPGLALLIQIAINLVNMALTVALVLFFDFGVAGAALAALVAEAFGLSLGLIFAARLLRGQAAAPAATIFDRARLLHMLSINRDIMIRTAALIGAYLFFVSRGARAGDVTLAANAILHNITLVGSFFLDGIANAAEQLCGRTYGGRDKAGFMRVVQLVIRWGVAFGAGASALFFLFGGAFIDHMTASPAVQRAAHDYLWLTALTPIFGALAFCYDGIYIGATWARDMRNLMAAAFAGYLLVWWIAQPLGNTGLWIALLSFFVWRAALQTARYPTLVRMSFPASPLPQR
jgi:MATE family multidrug resistance protein